MSGKIDLVSAASKFASVNKAFSKQSDHFDEEDIANPVLQDMRKQVYAHIKKILTAPGKILELNAGTGIDAVYLANQGHSVYATDLSDGMIERIRNKISMHNLGERLRYQQVSYDRLEEVNESGFDFVFSNFGGLNCIQDLGIVTKQLPRLLKPGSYVTFVVMPPVCIWELAGVLKGNFKQAFRRLHKNGVVSHLEGEYFKTYYHSLKTIRKAFGPSFEFIVSEGLGAVLPPPYRFNYAIRHSKVYSRLKSIDGFVRRYFPFNRCADHIIVTFQYREF
jgi:ubiquinone/menaquinone biosynthesis C-methylase UbiE